MRRLTMQMLENCFERAKASGAKYVAVLIEMEGFPYDEVIINPIGNADSKLEYYKKVYNEDLTHKHSSGIRIVGFTYSNNMGDIEWDFYL